MNQKLLRYQISDWSQITQCLSNNSKNLYLTLSKYLDGNTFKGLVIQVNHTNYGTLFASVIDGSGLILTETDEQGQIIPFMSTDEILQRLMQFGFYITYDVKSNLPSSTLSFLATLQMLGFDKITKVSVQTKLGYSHEIWRTVVLAIKSYDHNDDLLTFGCKISRAKFNEKLAANSVINITDQEGMKWDWVTYIANISDIIDENIDPRDEFNAIGAESASLEHEENTSEP